MDTCSNNNPEPPRIARSVVVMVMGPDDPGRHQTNKEKETLTTMLQDLGGGFGLAINVYFANTIEEVKSLPIMNMDLVLLDVHDAETMAGARAALEAAHELRRALPMSRMVGTVTSTAMQLLSTLLQQSDKQATPNPTPPLTFDGLVHKPLVRFTLQAMIKAWLLKPPASHIQHQQSQQQQQRGGGGGTSMPPCCPNPPPRRELLSHVTHELRARCSQQADFQISLGPTTNTSTMPSSSSSFASVAGVDTARAVVRRRDASSMEGGPTTEDHHLPVIMAVDGVFQHYFKYGEEEVKDRDVSCLFGAATDIPAITRFLAYHFAQPRRQEGEGEGEGNEKRKHLPPGGGGPPPPTPQYDMMPCGRSMFINLYSKERVPFSCRLTVRFLGEKERGIGILVFTAASHLAYCRSPKMFSCLHPLGAMGNQQALQSRHKNNMKQQAD